MLLLLHFNGHINNAYAMYTHTVMQYIFNKFTLKKLKANSSYYVKVVFMFVFIVKKKN